MNDVNSVCPNSFKTLFMMSIMVTCGRIHTHDFTIHGGSDEFGTECNLLKGCLGKLPKLGMSCMSVG